MNIKLDTKTKVLVCISVVTLFFGYFPVGFGATADDLKAQKAATQDKINSLNKQIQQFQQQIATAQQKAGTLKNEIGIYDAQIQSTQLAIEAKQTQIEDTNLQIQQLQQIIDQKNKEITDNRQILAQLIVELNEFDDQYALKTTVGSENLSDFFDQIQYTQNTQNRIYQLVQKIKDLKAKLEAQQHDLQIQVKNLESLKEQLEITQDSLNQQKNQKQKLLSQTRGIESNYQKLVSASKQEEADLEKEAADLDAQIRAKLGNKTIPKSKGILQYPIDGVLTQKYGNTGFTALGYNFHNGIDIAAPAGAPIYAAADGTVYDTDLSSTQYGNWIAIKHSLSGSKGQINIVTLYGHMRTIKVKPGQKVQQGDLIGYEGNTGNTTAKLYGPERGYHLHFTVFDVEGFGVKTGAYTKTYGPYQVPYGYTYNPLDFL